MERQYSMILLLAVGLVLMFSVSIFAKEPTAAREQSARRGSSGGISASAKALISSLNAPTQTLRTQLAEIARRFLGLPYLWGGMSELRGVDCSGLVKMIFAALHIELPRTSREQSQLGAEVPIDELAMGDLLFFSSDGEMPSHVGVYIGDHRFIHAAKSAGRVIVSDLSEAWYSKRFLGARRIDAVSADSGKM
jgi:cell wall-associated NlpC family hydrolase